MSKFLLDMLLHWFLLKSKRVVAWTVQFRITNNRVNFVTELIMMTISVSIFFFFIVDCRRRCSIRACTCATAVQIQIELDSFHRWHRRWCARFSNSNLLSWERICVLKWQRLIWFRNLLLSGKIFFVRRWSFYLVWNNIVEVAGANSLMTFLWRFFQLWIVGLGIIKRP